MQYLEIFSNKPVINEGSWGHFSVIGWCRAEWEVLETVIGQVDEPFQVTLQYSSCLGENGATVALDSLELIDYESGKFIMISEKLTNSV